MNWKKENQLVYTIITRLSKVKSASWRESTRFENEPSFLLFDCGQLSSNSHFNADKVGLVLRQGLNSMSCQFRVR